MKEQVGPAGASVTGTMSEFGLQPVNLGGTAEAMLSSLRDESIF